MLDDTASELPKVLVTEKSVDPGPYSVVAILGGRALAQPLVETKAGRLQALAVGYDPTEHEWFDIFADSPRAPQEWGHWTGAGMRANSECIACHVTGFEKDYNPETYTYTSHWAEAGVGCEACHGPRSAHVAEKRAATAPATAAVPGGDRSVRAGAHAASEEPLGTHGRRLGNMCGPCHSLRRELGKGFTPGMPWLDFFEPVLADAPEYYSDGSLGGEAYEWGSFSQSLMHEKSVTCVDCHEVHSGRLVRTGNALCLGCHDSRLATGAHSHHGTGPQGDGPKCMDCHMPEQPFMVRDLRRDHAMVLPDPRLSAQIGARDPCVSCHDGKTSAWAAEYVERWFEANSAEREQRRQVALAFFYTRSGRVGVAETSALVRCTEECASVGRRAAATRLLQRPAARGDEKAAERLLTQVQSEEALVRLAAVSGLAELDVRLSPACASRRRAMLVRATHDRFRSLRTAAAWGLRRMKLSELSADDAVALERSVAELEQALIYQSDHGEPATTLGLLYEARGKTAEAERAYERTVAHWPAACLRVIGWRCCLPEMGGSTRPAPSSSEYERSPRSSHRRALRWA